MFGGNKPSKRGISLVRGRAGQILALGGAVIVMAVALWVGQFDFGEWRQALTPKPGSRPNSWCMSRESWLCWTHAQLTTADSRAG